MSARDWDNSIPELELWLAEERSEELFSTDYTDEEVESLVRDFNQNAKDPSLADVDADEVIEHLKHMWRGLN